jgi:Na+-transporting NADH:ubiquinone oxidoreductase subunit A
MTLHRIKRGLRLPITGEPEQVIQRGVSVSRVALVADDYVTLRPTMHVADGDTVRRG